MSNNFYFGQIPPGQIPPNLTFEQMNSIIAFRTLWLDLLLWTRDLIYSIADNHPNQAAITNRLYTGVPLSFYNALAVFYGRQIAEEFLQSLSSEILKVWRLIVAVRDGEQELVTEIIRDIYIGADSLATFLAGINPRWDRTIWRGFFIQYSSMLNELIVSIITGNYEVEIRVFDRIQNVTILMGNYMAGGILQSDLLQSNPQNAI